MADEIRINTTAQFRNGAVSSNFTGQMVDDVAGQIIGTPAVATTSWVALSLPASIASIKRLLVKNEDATNYIELSYDSGGSPPIAKLIAGDWNHITPPASTTAVYIRANTASCNISFIVCEP